MNFNPRHEQEVDVNITPLIDVVFLLLIFFMVSTTFVRESEIDLTLPEASAELRDEPIDKIEIAVDKKGQYFVNGKALINSQLETMKAALREHNTTDGDPLVIISADAEASHQSVITVMDAARQVGLVRVTFPTQIRPDDSSSE